MIWFWLNMPLAAAFFSAWVGIPLWLVFKHSERAAPSAAAYVPARARRDGPAALPVATPRHACEVAGV